MRDLIFNLADLLEMMIIGFVVNLPALMVIIGALYILLDNSGECK